MSDLAARLQANDRLLAAFRALWSTCPDQRFGQLVMNLSRTPGGFADVWEWKHGRWLDAMTEAAEAWAVAPVPAEKETPNG